MGQKDSRENARVGFGSADVTSDHGEVSRNFQERKPDGRG